MRTAHASLLLAAAFVAAPQARAGGPQPAAARILVSFKLDPRMAGPTYGGDRWVSPPAYGGASAQEAVEIRAAAVDAQGRPTGAVLEWKSADPDLVAVAPARGPQVRISVTRAGESSVTVAGGGVSRRLVVRAAGREGARQVTIVQ